MLWLVGRFVARLFRLVPDRIKGNAAILAITGAGRRDDNTG